MAAKQPVPRDEPGEALSDDELLQRYGIDAITLAEMYTSWARDGVPKSVVEARYLHTRRFHGKLFSRLVRTYLGIETERTHPLASRLRALEQEVEELRAILATEGIAVPPREEQIWPDPSQPSLFDGMDETGIDDE